MNSAILMQFLGETGIEPEFDTGPRIRREVGMRYARYSARRRRAKAGAPRRLLADFIIGAHAPLHADRLITFDDANYKRDFPELKITPDRTQ
jgi:predicted nucleic acid-binding protein